MTAKQWERIDYLFSSALEIPEDQREAFLREASNGDTAILKEVLSLLRNFESACNFFSRPETASADFSPLTAGTQISVYRIEKELGRGGMSVVYEASRADGDYQEKVAIKVLKKGFDTEAILQRFRYEKQILASLRHPGIANILDGGETPSGQPYLIMELIDGQTLSDALASNNWSLVQKLKLFLQMTEAVQHAHNRLVVHRDLKPANIMITSDSRVKLLDFGIAKLLDESQLGELFPTRAGQRWLTPQYAAPEQKAGNTITPATDVYQLGLILFEMITGTRPAGLEETSVITLLRNSVPDQETKKKVKGDLEQILAMALNPDVQDRYQNAGEMGDDIKAYLSEKPVKARGSNWTYLTGKVIRRNRWAIVAVSLIMLSLVGGIMATTWQAARTQSALEAESLARAKAESITDFLYGLFERADPYESKDSISGKDLTLEQFVQQSLPAIRNDLAEQPEIQVEMLELMSKLYNRLSLKQESYEIGQEALEITRDHIGEQSPQFADQVLALAGAALDLDRYREADSLFRIAVKVNHEVYGKAPRQLEVVYNDFGILRYSQGNPAGADSLYRKALEIMEFNQISDTANYAQTLNNQAQALMALGDMNGAYTQMKTAIRMLEMSFMERTIFMTHAHNRFATILTELDSLILAEKHQALAVQGFREYLGEESHFYALGLYNLSKIYGRREAFSDQEKTIREAMTILEKIYGKETVNYGVCLAALGTSERHQGKYEKSLKTFDEALTMMINLDAAQRAAGILVDRAYVLMELDRIREAESSLNEAIELVDSQPDNHLVKIRAKIAKGFIRLKNEDLSEVERAIEEVSEYVAEFPENHAVKGEYDHLKSTFGEK